MPLVINFLWKQTDKQTDRQTHTCKPKQFQETGMPHPVHIPDSKTVKLKITHSLSHHNMPLVLMPSGVDTHTHTHIDS